jgi:CHAT domain-containing protein/tetratricopeptide (TPR) repeat protein
MGDHTAAEPLLRRALEIRRVALGEQHPAYAESLNNLANLYSETGNSAAAMPLLRQVVEIKRTAHGDSHPDYAASVKKLAELYKACGDNTAAEHLYRQAIEICRTTSGEGHPDYADSLSNLAELYMAMGDYRAAEPLYRQAVEIEGVALGEDHPGYAASLQNLAILCQEMGDYAAAKPLYRRAIEIWRMALGEGHPAYAAGLNSLAILNQATGDYEAAESLYRQAMEIHRAALGESHPAYANSLDNLANLYRARGEYRSSEPLVRQAMGIRRAALGKNHPDYAASLNNLAQLYEAMGDYPAAESFQLKATEILRAALGERHPRYATCLNNLAGRYADRGDYAAAEPLYREAAEIRRAALSADHPDYVASVDSLATLYRETGNYAAAEPLYRQVMEVRRAALGESHPAYASSLDNLAVLYCLTGDYASAEPLCRQAVEIERVAIGDGHPDYAASLDLLAALYRETGNYSAAEPLCRQAMEILRAALGGRHPRYATSLNNLAGLYWQMGDYTAAVPLVRQAMEITRAALGEGHAQYAASLNNLAKLHHANGDYAAAVPLYGEATEIRRAALGEGHPDYAQSLRNLALLSAATDREGDALDLMQQAATIDDRIIGQIFSIGSEQQRSRFLSKIQGNTDVFLSLVLDHRHQSSGAIVAALDLVLRRKALGAEGQATQRDAVRGGRYPQFQPRLRELQSLRSKIVQKTLAGPGPEGAEAHHRQLADWTGRRDELERDLARQIPEMDLQLKLRAADRRAVALNLAEGVALVEFVRFQVYDFRAVRARSESEWKPARYVAFVLRAGNPDEPHMVDLGEAGPIDRLIANFHAGVLGETEGFARRDMAKPRAVYSHMPLDEAGNALRAAVFDPLVPAFGESHQLFLAPDGALAYLPFEVLPSGEGARLIDDYRLSYLSCGRDVLRFAAESSGIPDAPLVMADPDFDLEAAAAPALAVGAPKKPMAGFWSWLSGRKAAAAPKAAPAVATAPRAPGRFSRDLVPQAFHFGRLPATRAEGEAVGRFMGVRPQLDAAALEGRLKSSCRPPRILHLATHGFFLPNQPFEPARDRHGLMGDVGGEFGRFRGRLPENPMLRSGLALAGANTWLKGGTPPELAEDGLLTAEDVSGLDLLSTELVVLSACETGLGQIHVGEGVFGLRRAFVLAGAKTLVMSLWKVPDEQTQELMVDFYRRLMSGEGRAEALRAAQLGIRSKYPDPFYWGAFICQGDPSPLRMVQPGPQAKAMQ